MNQVFVALAFADEKVGWVATAEGTTSGPVHLWHTQDGGESWKELVHNLTCKGMGSFHFVNARVGYALSREVWRTEDGGTTWRSSALPNDGSGHDAGFSRLQFVTANVGWLAGSGTIYHSIDGGATWTRQFEVPGRKGRPWTWGLDFSSPNTGWVAGSGKYLARTQDAGRTWRLVHAKHKRLGPFDRFTAVHFASHEVGVIAGQHNERERVSRRVQRESSPIAFGYDRPYILITRDGGRSWLYYDVPIPIGEWSRAGETLYGINTVDLAPGATGVVELKLAGGLAK
jgi:photosystem II stability/assembly factor-like uncharacterized protein